MLYSSQIYLPTGQVVTSVMGSSSSDSMGIQLKLGQVTCGVQHWTASLYSQLYCITTWVCAHTELRGLWMGQVRSDSDLSRQTGG